MTDGKDTVWHYRGREIPFDVADAGCAERLTEALSHIGDRTGGKSVPEVIEAHCGMIETFFDTLFGTGIGEALCGTDRSAAAYSEAYLDFAAFVQRQTERLEEQRREAEERYLKKRERFPSFARKSPDERTKDENDAKREDFPPLSHPKEAIPNAISREEGSAL